MKDIIQLIDSLKDWLYEKDGYYENRWLWRKDLIHQINAIRRIIVLQEKKHKLEIDDNDTLESKANKAVYLTESQIVDISCQIADSFLEELIPCETARLVHELDTNSVYYTGSAQKVFDKWYDVIENIIKEG